ncbi:hypothetical protein GWK47_019215 [Chionoecetes opilio]|uniref:Uncharacterized protein n=1 Tax=Chionoecetes opilio TaxID=41210 RepID=A0A8J4XQN0_CHIOP|nr:hypothetical protein GWK47_019215 [Chionoecetes opilio]
MTKQVMMLMKMTTQDKACFTIMKLRNLLREADNLTELSLTKNPYREEQTSSRELWDEGLIPYKGNFKDMEASACQKPITAFFKPSPASTPAKSFYTCYTSFLHTSQAACYSCYTR